MGIIYKTIDGQQFSSQEDAQAHENGLDSVKEQKLRDNLAIYLVNKSRLKAKILPMLEKEFSELRAKLPNAESRLLKNVFDDDFMDIYYDLIHVNRRLKIMRGQLCRAKKMITRINAALKAGKDFWCYELFDTPTEIG